MSKIIVIETIAFLILSIASLSGIQTQQSENYLPTVVYYTSTPTPTLEEIPTIQSTNTPVNSYLIDSVAIVTDTFTPQPVIEYYPETAIFIPTQFDLPIMPTFEDIYTPIYITNTPEISYTPAQEYQSPVVIDGDLDLDSLIDNAKTIASFFSPCTYPLPTPFVTWSMAMRASELQQNRSDEDNISIPAYTISFIMSEGGGYFPVDGNIRLPEDNVIGMLVPYYSTGEIDGCRNPDGFPDVYGVGVQKFLDTIYILYKE